MQWTLQPVGGFGFTLMVAAALALLVAIPIVPRPEAKQLWTLRGLRLSVVLLVLFALLRPTLIEVRKEPLKAALLLAIDSSESMAVRDSLADASRWEAATQMLGDSAGALAKLSERWDVLAYQFDKTLSPVKLDSGRLQLPAKPTGTETTLGTSLEQLIEREGSQRLLGIVLLSDGAQRATPPNDLAPQLAVRRLAAESVPLYTFAFGKPDAGQRSDLAITDLLTSDFAFAKAPLEIRGALRSQGLANQTQQVQLLWENADGELTPVAATQVRTNPVTRDYPWRLSHTPDGPGEYKLTVQVAPADGETVLSNNQRSTFVTVRDGGVKVLFLSGAKRIGGSPGREQRFLRSALAQSPDLIVTRQVFDYRQTEQSLTQELNRTPYDVFVIDDVDAKALDAKSWQAIAERVQNGAGLIMLGGYHSFGPGGHRSTALADALPIRIGRAERQNFNAPLRKELHLKGPLQARPSERFGMSHPILQIGAEVWPKLPPLEGANKFTPARLKPNAITLLETTQQPRQPLLVAGQAGTGRTLAFAGDSTWRWRLAGFGEPHRRFWRQAILWLAKKDDSTQNPVWVKLDTRRLLPGMPLGMALGVNPGDATPLENIQVDVTITTPSGQELAVPVANNGKQRQATFNAATEAGDYTVTVTATAGGESLGTASARFLVPERNLELDQPGAEPTLMTQLAEMTAAAGGKALAPEELPTLLEELANQEPQFEEEIVARITYWDDWPFFLFIVSLLGIDWFLRKRWGLV